VVAQHYIQNPLLIDGLKFDLRIYVLLYGINPMRIYIFEEGLARFATIPYQEPNFKNLNNMFMHLTNYAINKNSSNY
jgi:tubulin polyglutamylase TTLL6/13